MSGAAGYAQYAAQLRSLLEAHVVLPLELAEPHLDGRASAMLRKHVPLSHRRAIGAFFTSTAMRAHVTASIETFDYRGPFLDPTCGAGDLLLAAAATFTAPNRVGATAAAWSAQLLGCDREPHFTEVSRLRLRLAAAAGDRLTTTQGARSRHGSEASAGEQMRSFSQIRAGDGLTRLRGLTPFTGTILLNPPFGSVVAERGCSWGEGRVPRAGVFVQAAVEALAPGAALVAILPDVLRSGSRLRKWRRMIDDYLVVDTVRTLGRFDEHTDVDVFLLAGRRVDPGHDRVGGSPQAATTDATRRVGADTVWSELAATDPTRVGDLFEIRVGSVVDNRDPRTGPYYPFATARSLPVRGTIAAIPQRRRFGGTVRTPPFVLVRRTNRPAQGRSRAQGVLILGTEPVAVDNHLLVALPRDGKVRTCRTLLDALSSGATDEFLDERIRCRHLTVGALAEVPIAVSPPSPVLRRA
jgi:hypothetical protein